MGAVIAVSAQLLEQTLRRSALTPRQAGFLLQFQALIAAGGVAFPEPDLVTCGGITPWLKIAKLAEAANLPVTSHGVHDLHVHLLAAVPNASFLEVHGFGLDEVMAERLVLEDGDAVAPERPGHGVVFDWPKLEALATG
jgi:L-alanine-DL-glutamate epimerase-like enolase superfamily enzyme